MITARMDKLLVCVSERQATVACWGRGGITHLECFARSDEGLAAFRDFLAPHSGTPAFFLVDTSEEDYRIEAVPHCSVAERRQIVARKLKQLYRNAPYTAASLQDREPTGRRDDRYLFCALNNTELVEDWLRIVRAQELILAGVYLLPMVSTALPDKLRVQATGVLIAWAETHRVRVTFLQDRHLRMSRVAGIDTPKTDDVSQLILSEISNTRLYLHASRSASLDEPLTVLLIDRNDELEHVAAAIVRENPAVECMRADQAALCARLRIDPQHLAGSPDSVHLQLLGLAAPAGSLAPAAATRGYERYRARRKVYATCAVISSVAVLWSAANVWTAHETRARAGEVAARIDVEGAQYRDIARQLPRSPVGAQAMKRTVELSSALREAAREPLPMMAAISNALEPSPEIVLREFGWTYSSVQIQRGRDKVASEGADATAAAPAHRKQSAYVLGEIRPFRGDYRAAITSIDALVERLRRNPHVAEVRTVRMPLDVRPSAALSGTTLDASAQPASTEFEILIMYQPRA